MKYYLSKPAFHLSPYVKHFWAMDNCLPEGKEHIQRIIPNGLPEIIFYFDKSPVTFDADYSMNENTLITGQLNNYYDLKISGKISLFSILFHPIGLHTFLDIPVNEIFNQKVPLKFFLKNEVDELENKLYESGSFQERIKLTEEFLTKLLRKREISSNFERINSSIKLINRSNGFADIDLLASEACFSRRQYERVFSQTVGISPKQFLKTVRLQNAIHKKSTGKDLNIADITYSCGYYDQAHMINDFKKLTGMTPKKFFEDSVPYSDYFD